MMGRLWQLRELLNHLGPSWLAFRLAYSAQLHLGWIQRRMPESDWDREKFEQFLIDPDLSDPETYLHYRRRSPPAFFFAPSVLSHCKPYFSDWDRQAATNPVLVCDAIEKGVFPFFGHISTETGFPPDWHRNPLTNQRTPRDRHWSEISDFAFGDIKVIWELSRFGFAYTLVRAYWRTADERYAELFWRLLEDWRGANPPQCGANWKCGQETSFRVMAWCFALYGFLNARVTTAMRVRALGQMIGVSGNRIARNIRYALSQRNNHGISEATGLWTIGALFPEMRSASEWRTMGKRALESQGRELIYDDGSFSQHSFNYQRLMLQDYLWALRIGDVQQDLFSDELRQRVRKAANLLYQVQDCKSGRMPCYGHNDGSLILPLNNCDSADFRPVTQAIHYLCSQSRLHASGVWDEDLLWLFGPHALASELVPESRNDLRAERGGYYTLRSENGLAFIRCATLRHRPSHADMLHVDLWWRGENIAIDPGTYSYNAPPPWKASLERTFFHNTVTVDDQDQMERVSRFLWLPWTRGRLRCFRSSESLPLVYWEGEHDGYGRLANPVLHRRGVLRIGEESWLILDLLDSRGTHSYRLHWLFQDLPFAWDQEDRCLTLDAAAGKYCAHIATSCENATVSLERADPHTPRGWRAPYYYCREPAISLDVVAAGTSVWFFSLLGSKPLCLSVGESCLTVRTARGEEEISLERNSNPRLYLIRSIMTAADRWELSHESPFDSPNVFVAQPARWHKAL